MENRIRLVVAKIFGVLLACSLPPIIIVRLLQASMIDFPNISEFVFSILNFPLSAITISGIYAAYKIRKNEIAELQLTMTSEN